MGKWGRILLVIKMKKKMLKLFKTLWVSALCLTVFVAGGYFYLDNANKPAKAPGESVPYRQLPENCGVLIESQMGKTLFYLDFEGEALSVVSADEIPDSAEEFCGYSVDHRIKTDYIMLEGLVDRLGGIDLETEGKLLNYSGAQVTGLIKYSSPTPELYRLIIGGIVDSIARCGLTAADLSYIIEKSETALTVAECYFWSEHLKELCNNAGFVY